MPLMRPWASFGYRLRLQVLLSFGLRKQAAGLTERRLQVASDDVHALATRAQWLAEEGDLPAAAVCLQRLLQIQPRQAAAWFNLGYVREQQGLPVPAEAAFRQAVECHPAMDRAWYGLALSLIAQQRWGEAEVALHRTNELQPLSPFGWVQLARLHLRCQEPERARQVIEHLRGFEPRAAARLMLETGLVVPGLAGQGVMR